MTEYTEYPESGAGEQPANDLSSGHPAVDTALQALAQVADTPPADQVPAYQAAHRVLRETLASIDEQ